MSSAPEDSGGAQPGGRLSRWVLALQALALLFLAVAPSWNSLPNPYLRDDRWIVEENRAIRSLEEPARFFRDPGTYSNFPTFNHRHYRATNAFTLAIDVALFGHSRPIFRRTNLWLHALAALVFWGLAVRMIRCARPGWAASKRWSVAWVAAALWAVHPVSAFAAQYLSNRSLLILVIALHGGLFLHLGGPRDSESGWTWCGVIACLLVALASKENAVLFPGIVLLAEWCLRRRSLRDPRLWGRFVGYSAVVLVYLGFRKWMGLSTGYTADVQVPAPLTYWVSQGEVLVRQYLKNLVWWFPIRWEPSTPPVAGLRIGWVASCLGLGVGVATTLRVRARLPLAAFGWLGFLGTLFVTSAFPQPIAVCHYRPYWGMPFLLLGLVVLDAERWTSPRPRWLLPVLLYLAAGSWHVGYTQRSVLAAWRQSREHGASVLAEYNYVVQSTNAVYVEQRLRELLPRLSFPARAYWDLAVAQLAQGKSEEALDSMQQGNRSEPARLGYAQSSAAAAKGATLEQLLLQMEWRERHRGPEEVLNARLQVARIWPQSSLAAAALARALHRTDRPDMAAAQYRRAVALGDTSNEVRRGSVEALVAAGRCREAQAELRGLRLPPAQATAVAALVAGCGSP